MQGASSWRGLGSALPVATASCADAKPLQKCGPVCVDVCAHKCVCLCDFLFSSPTAQQMGAEPRLRVRHSAEPHPPETLAGEVQRLALKLADSSSITGCRIGRTPYAVDNFPYSRCPGTV